MKRRILLFAITMSFAASSIAQNIIHVPADQPTIQAGINAADSGDIVLVDEGTYDENINFMGKAITVASLHWQDGVSGHIHNTIIDGSQAANPDSASVVYFLNQEDTLSVLHGFTIRGGKGTVDMLTRAGGGIMIQDAGPKIVYNRIVYNECRDDGGWSSGGGIDIYNCYNNTPVIRDNEIAYNGCYKQSGVEGSAYGGAITVLATNECYIERNIILENVCYIEIPNTNALGAGIFFESARVFVKDNQVIGNYIISTDTYYINWGAGIHTYQPSDSSIISGNYIANNYFTALYSCGGGLSVYENLGTVYIDGNFIEYNQSHRGAGVSLEIDKDVILTNNVFKENSADLTGGAIWIRDNYKKDKVYPYDAAGPRSRAKPNTNTKDTGIPLIANNTFIDNMAADYEATSIHFISESTPLVAFNNIFLDMEGTNGNMIYISEVSATAYLYNNLLDTDNIECYGTWEGDDNIVCDPDFEDQFYHLAGSCCCINAGLESIEIEGTDYYCPDHDMDGHPRPQNGGVDIGADEKTWVGIEARPETLGKGVKVYPNPASELISLLLQPGTEAKSIEIIDIQGKVVLHQEEINNNFSVDVSNFPKGIYFVRIHTSEGIEVEKLIVQ